MVILFYINVMKKITSLFLLMLLSFTALFPGGVNESIVENTISSPLKESNGERSISEILYSLSNVYALLDRYYLYDIDNGLSRICVDCGSRNN